MFELKTILVAADFSEPATAAAAAAVTLARVFGATIHVVHVVEQAAGYTNIRVTSKPPPPLLRGLVDDARARLQEFVPQHLGDIPEARIHLRVGRPYEEVVRAAEESGADLVILGTGARSNVARVFLGSVAEKVIAHSPVPVLSLRKAPNLEPGLKLLVATDLSESSRKAARVADVLASGLKGTIDLMTVLEPPNRLSFWKMEPAEDLRQAEARLLEQLGSFARENLPSQAPKRLLVRVGMPAAEIVAAAQELQVDLLLMGVVGQTGFAEWLLGGVTERVLQASQMAMVTARAG